MANTETTVSNLKINRLTQTQLENASSLSNTEAYWVDPQFTGDKILVTDSNGDIVESTVTPSSIGTVKSVNNVSPDSNGNVAITTSGYHPQIFTFQWSDHLLNDIQWLRGDTFSWQDGSVYVTAYNHLVDDITGKSLQTETIAGYTISYYLADDGHKIAPDTEETDILGLYNDTGIAWYYILDTTNERFKFPRSKHNKYTTSLGVKGNGNALGITNGTTSGGMGVCNYNWSNPQVQANAYNSVGTTSTLTAFTQEEAIGVVQNSTNSGLITDNLQQDTDQYKYLYFYVGEYEQSAVEQTAGLNADLFNAKVDLNASNLNAQGQSLISGLPMPSDTYEKMTVGASGSTYTAPSNGWFMAHGIGTANGQSNMIFFIGNQYNTIRYATQYTYSEANTAIWFPVLKGAVVTFNYFNTRFTYSGYSNLGVYFVYAKGSESEA